MSKSNAFETDLLELIFNGTALADLAENDTTSPATDLYVSLHTGDPTDAGNQESNEADYTGYARVAVERTSSGWTVANGAVTNTSAVVFGQCSAGSNSVTHFGVGTASSGTGYLIYHGALSDPLAISAGITPQFGAGELDITED